MSLDFSSVRPIVGQQNLRNTTSLQNPYAKRTAKFNNKTNWDYVDLVYKLF